MEQKTFVLDCFWFLTHYQLVKHTYTSLHCVWHRIVGWDRLRELCFFSVFSVTVFVGLRKEFITNFVFPSCCAHRAQQNV